MKLFSTKSQPALISPGSTREAKRGIWEANLLENKIHFEEKLFRANIFRLPLCFCFCFFIKPAHRKSTKIDKLIGFTEIRVFQYVEVVQTYVGEDKYWKKSRILKFYHPPSIWGEGGPNKNLFQVESPRRHDLKSASRMFTLSANFPSCEKRWKSFLTSFRAEIFIVLRGGKLNFDCGKFCVKSNNCSLKFMLQIELCSLTFCCSRVIKLN